MAGVELSRIGQVHLRVGDVEAAERFYRDRLGMRYLFRVPGMVFFDCDGVRLMLGEPEGGSVGGEAVAGEAVEQGTVEAAAGAAGAAAGEEPGTILYFDVPDIRGAHAALEADGVHFLEPPGKVAELEGTELWLAFFRDPWANVLALMSEVPRAGSQ